MTIYNKLLYLSILFLILTSTIFGSLSFFIFEAIIAITFFSYILKNKEILFTKTATFVTYIFLILIGIGLFQASNFHTLVDSKTYLPFSICPFFTLENINTLFTYFMTFILLTQLLKTDKQVDKFLFFILILFGTILVLFNIFPHDELFTFFVLKQDIHRTINIFMNRNSEGCFFSLALFISLSSLLYDIFKTGNNVINKKFVITISLKVIITFLSFYYVMMSNSRGALLSTVISLFIFNSLIILNFIKQKNKKTMYISILLVSFIIVFYAIFNNTTEINYSSSRYDNESVEGRSILYKSAFKMLQQYPLTGIGLCCSKICAGYLDIKEYTPYLHNDWLEIALGYGYPIFIIILFLILLILENLIFTLKNLDDTKKVKFISLSCGLLSFSLASAVDFHFHTPVNAILFFITLSVVTSMYFDNNFKKICINKKTISVLFVFIALSIFLLNFQFGKVVAWRYSCFEKDHIKRCETCVKYSKNPVYLERLVDLYYFLMYNENKSVDLKQEYKEKTNILAKKYLSMYPYNKKMTAIYNVTK